MPISTLPKFVRSRLDPEQRYGLRVTLFAIAILLVFVPFGFLLRQVVDEGPITVYDQAVVEDLHELARDNPWMIPPLKVLSFLGIPVWFYFIVGAAVVFLWTRGRRRLVAYLIVTGLVGGAIDTVVKVVVARDRPLFEDPLATAFGQSFPSGHAFSSTAIYGSLLLAFFPVIPRRRRPWAVAGVVLLVAGIGFSRLALGVHFFSDVLGGVALGAAWLAASTAAFSIWRTERGRKPVEPMRGIEPEAVRDLKN